MNLKKRRKGNEIQRGMQFPHNNRSHLNNALCISMKHFMKHLVQRCGLGDAVNAGINSNANSKPDGHYLKAKLCSCIDIYSFDRC